MPVRMAMWLCMVLGMALALGPALTPPAAAQGLLPHAYTEIPEGDIVKPVPHDKPAERIAAEQALADTAEAACDTGALAGCTALGRAFMLGEGRPQNRLVAELLLRQACDGAEVAGCLALGQLLRSTLDPEALASGTLVLGRACRLGSVEGCAEEAEAVGKGDSRSRGNREAANALRRTACDKGSASACRVLGSVLAGSQDPATREEGLGLLARTCRAGDGLACGRILTELQQDTPVRTALEVEMAEAGCGAGLPYLCEDLARLLFEQGSGPPESRAPALAAYDRACALSDVFCGTPAAIRSRPALAEACQRGVQADCVALGRLQASKGSVLYAPAEALALLAGACEGGHAEACSDAAEALRPETPEHHAQAMRWLDLGCAGGEAGDCDRIGTLLLDGAEVPEDRPRGYAALAMACDLGLAHSCDKLDLYAMSDPEVPMVPVDVRYGPPLTAEELAEEDRREREVRDAAEARRCRSSAVAFRGMVYPDTICDRPVGGIILGRLANAGEAPWQALLWRPERMRGRTLTVGERVECGGALIREGWVLTAAHCVIDRQRRLTLTPDYRVRLGVLDIRAPDGVEFGIRRVFAHPRYHEPSRTFDIALVELDTRGRVRVGTPQPIKPILMEGATSGQQRRLQAGDPAYVFGWGNTAFGGQSSARLKVARLALEDAAQCEGRNRLSGYLLGSILCASAPDRAQACDGDSGGPLVSYEGRAAIIGVVSAGTECGRTRVPTRYTRVSKMADWITRVLAGQEAAIAPRSR